MKKTKIGKLTFLENNDSIEIIIPPARFNNYMTIVLIVMNLILLFPLSAIAYGIYSTEPIYTIILVFFLFPWLGGVVFANFFWKELFFNSTRINVNNEQICISRTLDKQANSLLLHTEEVNSLKILKVHTDSPACFPTILFLVSDIEYDLRVFTSFRLDDEEIVLIANKLNKYLKTEIVE
ncbi:hypothetical protein [Myxosarcina sp. GI1]|uniref:hypothetical protein n=1 Tax=Myxosarcina sp. GI1 TaxID=1541065 RepID=UPI000564E979|nr:hypothetical protein [Myxosarcina sp. GI1]